MRYTILDALRDLEFVALEWEPDRPGLTWFKEDGEPFGYQEYIPFSPSRNLMIRIQQSLQNEAYFFFSTGKLFTDAIIKRGFAVQ